jgi:NADH-quinone oxidoreductase subunit L
VSPALLLLLPLLSVVVIFFLTNWSGRLSSWVSVASVIGTLGVTLALFAEDAPTVSMSWIALGDLLSVDIGLRWDRLARGMMFVVTLIGTLVHVFSLAYMRDDGARARYFGSLSLFMFSMTGIVLADNLVMMFIFWELVGVSSYLLIGHWFAKASAADAAKKAFITNRIGDFGFLVGIIMLFGLAGTVSFEGLETWLAGGHAGASAGLLTAAALCIFCGAVGKSAQAPLHVWLPDAMEGPTPVSALIHAATMVAAGVFMLVRVGFLIEASAVAASVIAWIGGLTALLAALMATQQNDIKKVLAYSTLSQLGYMVMVVGLGSGEAAMFHLYTHAFFKALLFLGAGAVIYACHHEQNIWKMGGLQSRMPITFATFVVGTLALIACPLTSGFFSKEAILDIALHENFLLFLIAASVAFLTAFYMVRLVVVTFLGSPRSDHAEDAVEVGPVMWLPLVILAVFSVVAGYKPVANLLQAQLPDVQWNWLVFFVSLATMASGVVIGFFRYFGRRSEPLVVPLLANKFYFDEGYAWIVKNVQDALAWIVRGVDAVFIDGLAVGGLARITEGAGALLRRTLSGSLQAYSYLFGFGVLALLYLVVFIL